MAQIGLELAGRIFLARRADRHALHCAGIVQRGEERPIPVEILEAIDGLVVLALAGAGDRKAAAAGRRRRAPVDQIEFELLRDDGRSANSAKRASTRSSTARGSAG